MVLKKYLLLAGGLLTLPAYINCETAPTLLAQIPPTGGSIGTSGSYYLGFDVTGDITITESNVILDLNGHLVTGSISVSTGLSDVAIMNGFVNGISNPRNAVISVDTGCSNVHLSNITIRHGDLGVMAQPELAGITITNGTNITVEEIFCIGTNVNLSVTGLLLDTCSNTIVRNCVISSNSDKEYCLQVTACTKVLIEECYVSQGNQGFRVDSSSKQVTVSNCTAVSFTTAFITIQNEDNESIQLFNCVAEGNNTGFSISSDKPVYLEECIAYNNTTSEGTGFLVECNVAHVIKKCVAIGNLTGFSSTLDGVNACSPIIVRFIANYANANTTANYTPPSGDTFAPKRANGSDMQFWINAIALT